MLKRYSAADLTAVGDRGVRAQEFALYKKLKDGKRLPVRVVMTGRLGAVSEIRSSSWVTDQGDEWLKFGSF